MDLKPAEQQQVASSRLPEIKLPDFQSITKRIQEENELNGQQSLPFLQQYEDNRKKYEGQGFSHTTTRLIKALCVELESICPVLKDVALVRSVSLFTTLLMMREFEIVIWSSFCDVKAMKQVLNDGKESGDVGALKKLILNHLINTAYYTKRQVSSDEQFQQFIAFFDRNFQIFQGKHTDWLLLSEPDISLITPFSLNMRFRQLMNLYHDKLLPEQESQLSQKVIDFNEVANKLVFESEMQAELQLWRQNYRIKARKEKIEARATKKRQRKALGKQEKLDQKSQKSEDDLIQLKPLIDVDIGQEKQLQSPAPPHQGGEMEMQIAVSHQSSPNKKRVAPYPSDFMTKTVSNMIIQQMAAPIQPKIEKQVSQRGDSERNLNDSLMWQTMQSRIFDMNAIMRTLNDNVDMNQGIKSSNVGLPTMTSAFDGVSYNNAGAGSQVAGGNTLFGYNKGSSSILQIYNQNQQQPSQQQSGQYAHAAANHTQNATLMQSNSLLYQGGQQPQSSLSFFLGANPPTGNPGASAQPQPQTSSINATLMQSSSLLGAILGHSKQGGQGPAMNQQNIANLVRSHSQLQHNSSLQSVAHLIQPLQNQQFQGGFGGAAPQSFFQYSPRQQIPQTTAATQQEFGQATPQPKQHFNPNQLISPLRPIIGSKTHHGSTSLLKSPREGGAPPPLQGKNLFFASGQQSGTVTAQTVPLSSNQITSAQKGANETYQDNFQQPFGRTPSLSHHTLAKLRSIIKDDGKVAAPTSGAAASCPSSERKVVTDQDQQSRK